MACDQKHFFLGQSVGEMITESDRYLSADGASRLGKVLGVRPLMKPSDFVALLGKATEIQERNLESARNPPESESSPLALIASWCTTARTRSGDAMSAEICAAEPAATFESSQQDSLRIPFFVC